MRTIKLYKVNTSEAYRADEQGIRWFENEPKDSTYYKHEVLEEKEFVLPDEVKDGEHFEVHTEKDGRPFIETIDSVYYLKEA